MLARRQLLRASLAALAAPAIKRTLAASTQTLRLGYILPAKSQVGAGATAFAEEVAKRTAGRFTIQQFPDGTLGGDAELLKGVQLGSIDIGISTGLGLPSVLPEISVLNIPFLFRDISHAHAVLDGPVGDTFRQRFAAKDLIMLGWAESGMRHLTNSKRAIVTPNDLKGLKVRVPPSDVLLKGFQALGAEAASLPLPQLFEALRAGKFDGEENPIATIQAAKFNQVQKFLTLSAHAYDPAVFLMAPDASDELSPEDKVSFIESARIGGQISRKFAAEAEAAGVAALRDAGMVVQEKIDRESFITAMEAVMPEFAKLFGQNLIDQITHAG
jgi:tripartite ATP-independent transporter DctP family solute receptor